jgi:hypothetical protein
MAAKKTKSKAAAKRQQSTTTSAGPSIAAKVVASLPPLTAAERAELMLQYTDKQCEAWAERTQAADTLRDANKWLSTLHAVQVQLAPTEYHAVRLAFLAEQVLALEVAAATPATGAATAQERADRDGSFLRATTVRRELMEALTQTAGGREAVRRRITEAGLARTPNEALASLAALITLANEQLRDSPTASKSSGLTTGLVDNAERTRAALEVANRAAASGVIGTGDSADTNRLEGRVLRELRLAWNGLRNARRRDGRIPALVPGPALVRAFKLIDTKEPAAPPTA